MELNGNHKIPLHGLRQIKPFMNGAQFWGGKRDWFPKVEFDGIKLKRRYVQDSRIPTLLCFMKLVAFGGLTLALLWGTLS